MPSRPRPTSFAGSNGAGVYADFPPGCREICVPHPLASLTLFPVMLPIKSVAFSCPKGGKLMKHALIGGLSVLAMIVGVSAANAQANINPNLYPGNTSGPYGARAPWEWYASVGPVRRGNQCVVHVDPLRGYGFQEPCPAPKPTAGAAPQRRQRSAGRR